jgi:hypothetical protein
MPGRQQTNAKGLIPRPIQPDPCLAGNKPPLKARFHRRSSQIHACQATNGLENARRDAFEPYLMPARHQRASQRLAVPLRTVIAASRDELPG